jgi:cysteine desulfurase
MIYLDYNATTPLDPHVREAMLPFLDRVWGNPSSVHQAGRRARAMLDNARERLANVLGSKPSEIVFTSGGTEANNLAIFGTARLHKDKGKHLVTSTIEHHAVLHCVDYLEKHEGFTITRIPTNGEGVVNPDAVIRAIRSDTTLVSVMAANNEIGSLQPAAQIGAACQDKGVLFHTDAVQAFGKEPFAGIEQFRADLVSLCGHKFHGPKGAGALYIRSPLHPDPILFGGGHENERRAGTENLAAIAGLVAAAERFVTKPVFNRAKLAPLMARLENLTEVQGVRRVGAPERSLCNTYAVVVEGADSISLLANLDLEGICASSGSACSAGSLEPSHVIEALGLGGALANSLVRFSLGRETTPEHIERLLEVWPGAVARCR